MLWESGCTNTSYQQEVWGRDLPQKVVKKMKATYCSYGITYTHTHKCKTNLGFGLLHFQWQWTLSKDLQSQRTDFIISQRRNKRLSLGSWVVKSLIIVLGRNLKSGWVRTKPLVQDSYYFIHSIPIAQAWGTTSNSILSFSGVEALSSDANRSAGLPGRAHQMLSAWMAEHI